MTTPRGLQLITELVDVPIDSPMTDAEMERLKRCEEGMKKAFREELKAEIEHGEILDELKHHPRMLWQRSDMFRTKAGGWKKHRKWHEFVVTHDLAESGKEATEMVEASSPRERRRSIKGINIDLTMTAMNSLCYIKGAAPKAAFTTTAPASLESRSAAFRLLFL